jgi:hypothetical protein
MVRQSFARPSVKRARERNRNLLGTPIPLPAAIDAIERGITTRARHVWAPGNVRPLIWLRSVVQPLADRQARRAGIEQTIREVEQEESTLTTAQPTG